jgi:aquaporin Z
MNHTKILIAEAVGTMILVLGGPGTAILAAGTGTLGEAAVLGVSLAFGFSLLVAAYAIGPVSGCHINPAVTIGMAVMKKIEAAKVPAYILGQLIGAAVGGLLIWIIAQGMPGGFDASPATFAANLWGEGDGYSFFNFGAMAVTEIVMTAVLMFVVLSTTSKKFTAAAGGLTVGITLALIHLISIPVDNTSVNPARSFATALFAGGDAVELLWAFVVFPIIGAIVGALVWIAVDDSSLEDSNLVDR